MMELDEIRNRVEIIMAINALAATVTFSIAKYEELLKECMDSSFDISFTFEEWEKILEKNDPIHGLSRQIQEGIFEIIQKINPFFVPMSSEDRKDLWNLVYYAKETKRILERVVLDLKNRKESEQKNEILIDALIGIQKAMAKYLKR